MIWFLVLLLIAVAAAPFVIEARRKPMDATARANAPGQMASLSQGQTHYHWIGPLRGPVAVCVHGMSTPSFVWDGLAQGLAGMGFRVLVYDLYGRGYSDRPKGRQDRAFFQRQLEDLLEDQGVSDDFTLLGYSMGGAIATCFAAAHPTRVRQLILLAPAGLSVNLGPIGRFIQRTPVIGDWLMLSSFGKVLRDGITKERQEHTVDAKFSDLQLRELQFQGFVPAMLSSLRGILTEDLSTDHQRLHLGGLPVLAVWGRRDTTIPISAMGQLTKCSRSTRHEVLDDAGHGLTYTHIDDVLKAISDSLREGLA